MSDLQCPATFLLVATDAEPAVVERAVARDRVAEVRAAPHPEAIGLARSLAGLWSLPDPLASDLEAASYRDALSELADLRRGETTVVVVDRALLEVVAGAGPGAGPDVLEVLIDADGWVVSDRDALPDRPEVRDSASG